MKRVFLPLKVCKRGADGDLSINLLRFEIHQGGSIVYTAQAGILSCIEEDCFRQGGLSFPTMAEGSYISNGTRFNAFHLRSFPSSIQSR